MPELTSLVTNFGYTGDTAPLDSYNNSLGKGIGLLAGMAAATIAAGWALKAWVADVNAAIDVNAQLSRVTGESIEFIQEMGFAASVNGSSIAEFNSAIRNLAAVTGEAALGIGRGRATFEQLGLSARNAKGEVKSAQDIFMELTERFQDLSQAEKIGLARKLGINPSLIQLMSKTGRELDELAIKSRRLGIVTEEQANSIVDYNDAVTAQTAALDGLKQQIAVGLAPQLQGMAEWITDLIVVNKEWIVEGIQKGFKFIEQFIKLIERMSPILITLTGIFVIAKIATFGFAKAFAVLLSPVVLIAAGIALLVLIIDDLIVAFKGGDSVIADFFDGFDIDIRPMLKRAVEAVIWFRDMAVDILSDAFLWIAELFGGGQEIKINTGGAGGSFTLPVNSGGVNNNSNIENKIEFKKIEVNVNTSDPVLAGNQAADGIQSHIRDAALLLSRTGGF